MAAVAKIFAAAGVQVLIHAFTDGRDTPPKSALDYLADFRKAIAGTDGIRFATLSGRFRSEEHTSELQSLMRISYAVFCLKQKTAHNHCYQIRPTRNHQRTNSPRNKSPSNRPST